MMIILAPMPHRLMMISAGMAHCWLASQSGPLMPTRRSKKLIMPTCGLNIQIHMMAMATPLVTDGR